MKTFFLKNTHWLKQDESPCLGSALEYEIWKFSHLRRIMYIFGPKMLRDDIS